MADICSRMSRVFPSQWRVCAGLLHLLRRRHHDSVIRGGIRKEGLQAVVVLVADRVELWSWHWAHSTVNPGMRSRRRSLPR